MNSDQKCGKCGEDAMGTTLLGLPTCRDCRGEMIDTLARTFPREVENYYDEKFDDRD